MKRSMRLLITYNTADESQSDDDPDLISEIAVRDEAHAVGQAASDAGYEVSLYPVRSVPETVDAVKRLRPDVIFNLCEGFNGSARHEMHVASLWELLQIPYTGNSPLTLGMAQDKILTKRILETKNIHTPAYQVFERKPDRLLLDFPVIVKPSREDASLGIGAHAVVRSMAELQASVERLLGKYRQPVLTERFIEGREFNISVAGTPGRVLAVSEIDFSRLADHEMHITSYEAKWMPDHPLYRKTPVICPARVTEDVKKRLEDTALQVYHCLYGRDYGRVDIRVDREGRIWVLEFNPNPDISPDAGFTKAVKAAGMTAEIFVQETVEAALKRSRND